MYIYTRSRGILHPIDACTAVQSIKLFCYVWFVSINTTNNHNRRKIFNMMHYKSWKLSKRLISKSTYLWISSNLHYDITNTTYNTATILWYFLHSFPWFCSLHAVIVPYRTGNSMKALAAWVKEASKVPLVLLPNNYYNFYFIADVIISIAFLFTFSSSAGVFIGKVGCQHIQSNNDYMIHMFTNV